MLLLGGRGGGGGVEVSCVLLSPSGRGEGGWFGQGLARNPSNSKKKIPSTRPAICGSIGLGVLGAYVLFVYFVALGIAWVKNGFYLKPIFKVRPRCVSCCRRVLLMMRDDEG